MVKGEPDIKEKIDKLDARVNTILTNEIPHINGRITELENIQKQLSNIIYPTIGSIASLLIIIGAVSFLSGLTKWISIIGALLLLGLNLKSLFK